MRLIETAPPLAAFTDITGEYCSLAHSSTEATVSLTTARQTITGLVGLCLALTSDDRETLISVLGPQAEAAAGQALPGLPAVVPVTTDSDARVTVTIERRRPGPDASALLAAFAASLDTEDAGFVIDALTQEANRPPLAPAET
jgi:hypothetical protein